MNLFLSVFRGDAKVYHYLNGRANLLFTVVYFFDRKKGSFFFRHNR